MGRRAIKTWIIVGAVSALISSLCEAREPYVEFLRGLQKRGMGEQGLAYIEQIASRADLPAELKEALDLERSKCLRVAAVESSDAQQRSARLAESKRLSEKFFAEHPNHPAAASVVLSEGDDALAQGEHKLATARAAKDGDLREKAFAEARQLLGEAHSRYERAVTTLKARLDAVGAQTAEGRGELVLPWVEARSKSAYTSYLLSQTYSDPKAAERRKLLEQAGRGFDGVYQEFKNLQVGLLAHVWHGKTLAELGEAKAAMDVFDGVLIVDPETPDADIELAALFGRAELFRLQLLAQTESLRTVIDEGEQWMAVHKKWQSTSPYQGIALEVAKARLRTAESARPADRTKLMRDGAAALALIGKVESEFRQEALQLRRETITKMGIGSSLSLPEGLALADEAANDGNWAEAVPLLRQALEMATKANDAKNQDAVKAKLAQALYRQAVSYYAARDLEKALAICGELVRDHPNNPVAQDASSVAIAAAVTEYFDAAEESKAKAQERLDRVAGYALTHWPDKPVADDARMALAQAALHRDDLKATQRYLADVGSQSKRYAAALHLMAQVHWRQYLTAKKSSDEPNQEELVSLREQAIESLKASLERQRGSWSTSEPIPAALFETQLLLAEIYLEGRQWSEAAPLLAPLVEFLNASKPAALDRSDQRALVAAIRVALAMNRAEQAAMPGRMLIEQGPDDEQTNGVLVELAKLVGQSIKQKEAATPADQTTFAATSFASPLRDLQGRLIEALTPRKSLTVQQLIYLGDACVSLDRAQEARDIYERVLAAIDRDEAAKASAGGAAIGIRARFVSLLRKEGQLEEAGRQVEALIKERPNVLEPLMEKGYILQSQAERDPKRYDECINHWTALRVRLERSKLRQPVYYDVLYNAADCLVRQARATNNKEKALLAEQMLKSTLTLTPNLNGPEAVAKYQTLLNQAVALRGPVADKPTEAAKR